MRLGRERGVRNLHFALADGMALPFAAGSFDLVLSHAVIEHVADAPLYLRECARVLAPGGHVYLSTAPYLSFAGAHLPRLKVPGAAAPDRRTARRVRGVPHAGAARGLGAQGTGEREFVHQGGAARRGQGGRPAREGPRRPASPADRRCRTPRSSARSCTSRPRCAGCRRRSRAGCATARSRRTRSSATWNTCWRGQRWLRSTDIVPEDRRAVEALYRRVFGNDAAEASRLRWDWQYRRNPNNPGTSPRSGSRAKVRPSSGSTRRCR